MFDLIRVSLSLGLEHIDDIIHISQQELDGAGLKTPTSNGVRIISH